MSAKNPNIPLLCCLTGGVPGLLPLGAFGSLSLFFGLFGLLSDIFDLCGILWSLVYGVYTCISVEGGILFPSFPVLRRRGQPSEG